MNEFLLRTSVLLAILYVLLVVLYRLFLRPRRIRGFSPSGRVVVITGCDSGFGRLTAVHLLRAGYTVVAGCYTQAGVQSLLEEARTIREGEECALHALRCDVTSDADVAQFVAFVTRLVTEQASQGKRTHLWALINNAGVAPTGFTDWISAQSVRKAMEVNYFALVNVTKAFLPLLKCTRNSRILNVSSAAGYAGFPGGGAYCASKHAVEGFAKCLRQELFKWNIHVCNVNPGFMKTPIIDNAETEAIKEFESAPKEISSQYSLEKNVRDFVQQIHAIEEDPQKVVHSMRELLEQDRPFLLNPSGWQAHAVRWLQFLVPHGVYCHVEKLLDSLSDKGPFPHAVKAVQTSNH